MNFKSRFYLYLNRDVFLNSIKKGGKYRIFNSIDEIELFQIERFNFIWKDAFSNIPFYHEWKKKYNLPDRISTLAELSSWPVLTKKDLQENKQDFVRKKIKPTGFVQTGGSTGEPLHLPTWKDVETSPGMWLGRSSYGIDPGMKTFLIWGHRHLYGKGVFRQFNIIKRNFKDWLSNMKRVSAYDISEKAMKSAFKKYLNFQPEFIIGFSASVLAFVRVNKFENKLKDFKTKAVLCTAGPLSVSEINEITSFFNAPVCMEYGSVECGVMAYTEPKTGNYITFWDTHIIQGFKDNFGEIKNIVTRLTECYVPLIRYDIGDYLELEDGINLNSILKVKTIKGRPSDMVRLNDGTTFFGALIGDCIKQVDTVIANQLHVYNDGICIHIVSQKLLTKKDFSLIQKRLITVVPGLNKNQIYINQVQELFKTVGGKVPLVVQNSTNMPTAKIDKLY